MKKCLIPIAIVALFFCTITGVIAQPNQFYEPDPEHKISHEIHVNFEQRIQRQIQSGAYDLFSDESDYVECAVYVKSKLTPEEIAQYRSNGIQIHEQQWIPPVTNHHPYGFYLADIRLDRLYLLETDSHIVKVDSTEYESEAHNDLGAQWIGADRVHQGLGITSRTGQGVNIAIADSSLDLTHPDAPVPIETFDVTTGEDHTSWSTDVSSTEIQSNHGTHVTGTVLGRGTASNGTYKGIAPGANLYFYKIAKNSTGRASDSDEIKAINRALAVGCDIFSMSFGGYSTFSDGSSSVCQAIDYAVEQGMLVFNSAGNNANDDEHYSATVAPGSNANNILYTIDNSFEDDDYDEEITFRVIWIDDNHTDKQMALSCSNLSGDESLEEEYSGFSQRGTEGRRYTLTVNVEAGSSKTYRLSLSNTAASGETPLVHIYRTSRSEGTFDNPDLTYTVSHPALADRSIAVGAIAHRTSWVNYLGDSYSRSYTIGEITNFSSRGPRVDGLLKPNLMAPGAMVVSMLDSEVSSNESRIIDNDGLNLDGSGPAQYYMNNGTSMSCPMAAGAAALILESDPILTPDEVIERLTSTADNADTPNSTIGYGTIDVYDAIGIIRLFSDQSFVEAWTATHQSNPQGAEVSIAGAYSNTVTMSNSLNAVVRLGMPGITRAKENPDSPIFDWMLFDR
jgi:subtilisin family serine protease